MSTCTPDQVLGTPPGDLARQPAETLFRLKNNAANLLASAKALAAHIDRALELKYAERAQTLRLAVGKDTGVVHFDDGPVRVTADLPKRVSWDQKQLAEIVHRIEASGVDPAEYVEISYRVPESRFNAWPESIRQSFEPARILKTGKPSFRLSTVEEK